MWQRKQQEIAKMREKIRQMEERKRRPPGLASTVELNTPSSALSDFGASHSPSAELTSIFDPSEPNVVVKVENKEEDAISRPSSRPTNRTLPLPDNPRSFLILSLPSLSDKASLIVNSPNDYLPSSTGSLPGCYHLNFRASS
jgi:hypothetical protein